MRCEKCLFGIVPGEGPSNPEDVLIAIIAQNPGSTEFARNRPLVGPTGAIVRGILEAVGYPVDDHLRTGRDEFEESIRPKLETVVYLTNASKCDCPPDQQALLQEFSQFPNLQIIVPMGRDAYQAIMDTDAGIMANKGALTWSDTFKNWVLPTLHPATIFRTGSKVGPKQNIFYDLLDTLLWLPEVLENGPPKAWNVDWRTIDDPDWFVTHADRLMYDWERLDDGPAVRGDLRPRIAMDIESSTFYWWNSDVGIMSIAWAKDKAIVLTKEVLDDPRCKKIISDWFTNPQVTLIGQNFPFDSINCRENLGIETDFSEDTMLAEFALNTRSGRGFRGLEDLARRLWQGGDWKTAFHRYVKDNKINFLEAPPELLHPYAAKDAAATWYADDILQDWLEDEPDVVPSYRLMIRAAKMFEDLDTRGLYIGLQNAETQKERFVSERRKSNKLAQREIARLLFEHYGGQEEILRQIAQDVFTLKLELTKYDLIEMGFDWEVAREAAQRSWEMWELLESVENGQYKINLNSPLQLRKILFDHLEYKPVKWTPKKAPSTDKEVLHTLSERHPETDLWQHIEDFRHATKMLGTYVVPYSGKWAQEVPGQPGVKVIYPDTSLTSTDTGRLSTRKGRSAAVMTYPRDTGLRSMFVAGPYHWRDVKTEDFDNYFLAGPDYSQLEFRLAAWMSNCAYAIEKMREGLSFHRLAARMVYGHNDYSKLEYTRIKNLVFGLTYSGGNIWAGYDPSLMDKKTVEEVDDMFKTYMPELFEWFDHVGDQAISNGVLLTPYGRKFYFPYISKSIEKEIRKKAVNAMCQSPASDLNLTAMLTCYEELDRQRKLDLRWSMHDAQYAYVHREDLLNLLDMWDIMENAGNKLTGGDVPIVVEMSVGKDWGHMQEFGTRDAFVEWARDI